MRAEFGILREKNNTLFYNEYKNCHGSFHFHSQIELLFVDEGEMEVFINNYRKTLKQGEMSVALSYDAHAYKTPESSYASLLDIPAYMCEEFINVMKNKRVTNPFITNTDAVKKIKDCIREIHRIQQNDILLSGYIYVILGIIMENIDFRTTKESVNPELSSRILFYINENFKKDISLAVIALEMGYSQSYLSRYFKSCFNIGLNQYITIIRLKNALLLMHEKKHNLTYCAFESGFNSMRTFYRVFFNEFGCSPKEYFKKNIPSEQI